MFYLSIKRHSFCGTWANSAGHVQTRHNNVASDQGLHCLLEECTINMSIQMENTKHLPLKQKWTGPFDKSGEFHLTEMGSNIRSFHMHSGWIRANLS